MDFQRGDVVRVNLGSIKNGIVGSEQAFTRPCIILQTFHHLDLVTIIPLTTRNKDYMSSTSLFLIKGTGGLAHDSFALCHQLRTISQDRIIEKLGTLSAEEFNALIMVVKNIFF